MELKVKTSTLQEMVTRVSKCVSNNKLIPITSLISIKVEQNTLTLTATDATNYFYVRYPEPVDCEDFEVSVIADIFVKLIQKTTTEHTSLILDDGVLDVKGNGTYKLELPLDENGSPIKFVDNLGGEQPNPDSQIKRSLVDKILNYNKPSLAEDVTLPALCSYYCANSVVTSNAIKACDTPVKLFDKPLLITPQVMELLGVFSEEDINVQIADSVVFFWTKNDVLYAPIVDGISTFPIEQLSALISSPFESTCKIDRAAVIELLDRMSLFVGSYDKKCINLTFTKDGIMFSSVKSSSAELLPYIESENFKDYTCGVNIEYLRSQIAVQEGEAIELSYGSDIALKMVVNGVTQIVALMED
jgi:DNA polymerase III sliding clamp (beta) subunit (PCNA family)